MWLAWQFDLPEKGEGMVQALRREQSAYETGPFPLRGLAPAARYTVTDPDSPEAGGSFTGLERMTHGLPVRVSHQAGAVVLTCRRTAP
jgi:alpha-galactosidase